LKKEFSDENIEFWLKCEKFKKIHNQVEMSKESWIIWNDYLDVKSIHQINIDNKAKIIVKEALSNPNKQMFEVAQSQVKSDNR
jgi:regulator of G-protein signaling